MKHVVTVVFDNGSEDVIDDVNGTILATDGFYVWYTTDRDTMENDFYPIEHIVKIKDERIIQQ